MVILLNLGRYGRLGSPLNKRSFDDGVGAGNGGGDRGLIGHVGGDDRDPVETHRSQLNPRRVRMPHRDAYSHPLGEQAMYESPTEETGTAKTPQPWSSFAPVRWAQMTHPSTLASVRISSRDCPSSDLGPLDVERRRHRQRLGERQIDGAALLPGLVDPTNRVPVLRRLDGDGQADIAHIGRDAIHPQKPARVGLTFSRRLDSVQSLSLIHI